MVPISTVVETKHRKTSNLNEGGGDLWWPSCIYFGGAIFDYTLLPEATTHVMGDNREFEVQDALVG